MERNDTRAAPRRLAAASIALGLTLAAGAGTAQAARYGVHVVDGAGEPVAGASVCIGIEGSFRRFGAMFTDVRGRAELVEVPDVPLVVTVSKTRFSGLRFTQPARRFDLVREVVLEPGLPGPRCKAGSSLVANPPSIGVLRVDVTGERDAATLRPEVTGEPSHYRLGFDESFDGAVWQRFERAITVPNALAGVDSVYLQLRRLEGSPSAWLEARSDAVQVALPRRRR